MLAVLALALAATPTARLHLSDQSQCVPAPALVEAISLRMPDVKLAPTGAPLVGEDRLVTVATSGKRHRIEVTNADRNVLLERLLPSSCGSLDDVVAAVIERHFTELHWAGLTPSVTLPESPPGPAVALVEERNDAEPAVVERSLNAPEEARAVANATEVGETVLTREQQRPAGNDGPSTIGALELGAAGTFDSAFAPAVSLSLIAQRGRFSAGLSGASTLEQRTSVIVGGEERGELRWRTDTVAAHAGLCTLNERLNLCGGAGVGALLLTGDSRGLHQRQTVTLAAFGPALTASASYRLSERWFLSARLLGLLPTSAPSVSVEGTAATHSASFQALTSLNLGFRIF